MIDVENAVYTTVHNAVKAQYPNTDISGIYAASPAKFPHVSLVEDDNYILERTQDENVENDVRVMYTLSVYSNKAGTSKSEAKKIMAVADAALLGLNFTRMSMAQIPNEDRTIYRIVARYEAVIHKGIKSGDNTIYQVYRH